MRTANILWITKEIDFNDMINLASEYVRQGKYINPYKYVIVDEYQDISKARFMLLDCLRKSEIMSFSVSVMIGKVFIALQEAILDSS